MVMILSRSLDNQGADSIACRIFNSELHTPRKMSHGPTLFSCGIMVPIIPPSMKMVHSMHFNAFMGLDRMQCVNVDDEEGPTHGKLSVPAAHVFLNLALASETGVQVMNDRWRDLDRKCPLQIDQPSASLWECLPEKCPDGALWHQEAATACAVTSLIQDLSLSDHNGNPSAPPSKRQCRSLSFSDEMSSCRTSWRPLGSKVWTPVEKRRCHSGGSVPRYAGGPGTMQRSSSFSLPSRASVLSSPCDQAGFPHPCGGQPGQGAPGPAACGQAGDLWSPALQPRGGARLDMQRSLSCSHERFSFAEYCAPSASSTPASTPELARRPGGLSRSRSQPCVLNDKKVGVKRRRPEEVQEQRPSLDLAKMAQNCETFSSLSCLSSGTEDPSPHSPFPLHVGTTRSWTALLSASASCPGGRTPAGTPVPEPHPPSFDDHLACREELCCEELDGCTADEGCGGWGEPASAWRDRGAARSSPCSLDGELDIEQIENN